MLNEAAMKKKRWVTKKEKREVRDRFVDVVFGIREVNKINKKKENILSEPTTNSEMPVVTSDVITVKKERKPRIRNKDNYGRLRKVSLSERRFLNDALLEAKKVKGSKLADEERRKVLCVARDQIRGLRKANQFKSIRNKERFNTMFEWEKP